MSKRLLVLTFSLLLGLSLSWLVTSLAASTGPQTAPQVPLSVNSGQHFLPPYGNERERFGFDSGSLSGYDVAQLNAGWYSNWGANANPAHPDQLVYVQLIRFSAGTDRHDPDQVTVSPSKATIAQIAQANPGSLWLMSNEPDSLYQGNPILPEVYAIVYHEYYEYIKGLDPSALIANGGIVQPTPCRLEYLDIVWDTYSDTYQAPMPVDVWNIHAFILREVYGEWGASTPPGVDPDCGIDYSVDDSADMTIFEDNIRAMRAWLKEKGEQDKPLIVSEYGILWPEWFAPQYTPQRVSEFMIQTFDLFLSATDPDIGHPADQYRLVQAWAWYSLSDDRHYNGYLFHSDTKTLSPMGEAYAQYTAALSDVLYADLSARLLAGEPERRNPDGTATLEPLELTLPITAHVSNLGKLALSEAKVRWEIMSQENGSILLSREQAYDIPSRFDGVVALPDVTATVAAAGLYELIVSADPDDKAIEPREYNNVVTAALDLRPDWTISDVVHGLSEVTPEQGQLNLTVTVSNQGNWPAPATRLDIALERAEQGTALLPAAVEVPPLATGEAVSLTKKVLLSSGLYTVALVIDADNEITEAREDNNHVTETLDLRPDLVAFDLAYQLQEPVGVDSHLVLTTTVGNQGNWPSRMVDVIFYVEPISGQARIDLGGTNVPVLETGTQTRLVWDTTWPLSPTPSIYQLYVELDAGQALSEQDETNNRKRTSFFVNPYEMYLPLVRQGHQR
jgi:hypothetical protein